MAADLQFLGTQKPRNRPPVRVYYQGVELSIEPWKGHEMTVGSIMASLRVQAAQSGISLPPRTIVHRNVDGSFAIGIGLPPGPFEWPDEEKRRLRLERQGYLKPKDSP